MSPAARDCPQLRRRWTEKYNNSTTILNWGGRKELPSGVEREVAAAMGNEKKYLPKPLLRLGAEGALSSRGRKGRRWSDMLRPS